MTALAKGFFMDVTHAFVCERHAHGRGAAEAGGGAYNQPRSTPPR